MTATPRLTGPTGSTARRGSQHVKGRKSNLRDTPARPRNRERSDRFAGTIKKVFYLFFLSLPLITLIQTVLGRTPDYRVEDTRTPPGSRFGLNGASIPSRQDVESYVRDRAVKYGVDPRVPLWIAGHESQFDYLHGYFDPAELGDDGQSRGLWQINRVWHPEVTDACAFDMRCSTEWSLQHIAAGSVDEWSTWKYRFEWYEGAPK